MTSGSFSTIPITQIWVDRATRQRRDLADIPALADSIRRLGLIHPPVVTRDNELKSGERRWEACKSLGWTSIPVQFTDELDPAQLKLLELEENIKRLDISWQENCDAVNSYHELRLSLDPAWTAGQTAEAIGESPTNVSRKLMVVREMKNGNALIHKADKLSTAVNVAQRTVERRKAAAIQAIEKRPEREVPLVNADFTTMAWDGEVKFNFIHCDFPYGINQQDHDKQGSTPMAQYEDSFDAYSYLCDSLGSLPCAESAHLLFWFSMEHYSWTYDRLTRMGWTVNKFPLIWSRGSSGILPDPARGPRRVYETAFMASRGDRKIVSTVANHIAYFPTEDRIHSSEKPRPVLEHFFRMFVDEYTVMIDPTCGSANAVRTAQKMGAKYVLGIEKEKEFYEAAKQAYFED